MSWTNSLLSFARDERVILVSLGLATFGIVSTMFSVLTFIRDENEIPPPQPKTQYITQDTEDSLQLDTLENLLDHPNYSIREIAIKILCDRAVNDPDVIDILLYEITRPDYDQRMRGLRTLALLTNQTLEKLHNPKAYSAIVRCLEICLTDSEPPSLTDRHWDEYYLRDMAERFCFMFIIELVNKYGPSMLIKARFVEKWLAKQDWGNDPEERRRSFRNYMQFRTNRIVEIVDKIRLSRRGLKALEKVGLIDKEKPRRFIRELPEDLVLEIHEEASDLIEQHNPRAREHSAEEQRLRRQHREAMVLNDGTRPLGRDDIIERDHDSPP